jgi:hypothetical protein
VLDPTSSTPAATCAEHFTQGKPADHAPPTITAMEAIFEREPTTRAAGCPREPGRQAPRRATFSEAGRAGLHCCSWSRVLRPGTRGGDEHGPQGSRGAPARSTDHPRDWVEFADPPTTTEASCADLTWLLSSGPSTSGGATAASSQAGRRRLLYAATRSGPTTTRRAAGHPAPPSSCAEERDWQHASIGRSARRQRARPSSVSQPDGPAPWAVRACSSTGPVRRRQELRAARAQRSGLHPLQTKPDVCWQYSPVRRSQGVSPDRRRRCPRDLVGGSTGAAGGSGRRQSAGEVHQGAGGLSTPSRFNG